MRWHMFKQVTLFQFRVLMRNKVALFFNLVFPLLMMILLATLVIPQDRPVGTNGIKVVEYLMPGLMTYMLLSSGLMTVSISLAHHRESGTHRHLLSTPLPLPLWVTARVFASLFVTGLQLIVLYAAAMAVYDVSLPRNVPGMLALAVLGTVASVGLGVLVGSMSRKMESALGVSMVLYMGLAALGGAMMPLDQAPAALQNIARFTPSFYIVDGMRQVAVLGQGLGTTRIHLAVLAGVGIVCLGAGVWQLRRQAIAA